jgi:hypothetical protein
MPARTSPLTDRRQHAGSASDEVASSRTTYHTALAHLRAAQELRWHELAVRVSPENAVARAESHGSHHCMSTEQGKLIMSTLRTEDTDALRHTYIATYRAQRFYEALLARLGLVRPLPELCDGAARQIELLETLFERFGLAVPDSQGGEPTKRFSTIPQSVHAVLSAKPRGACGLGTARARDCATEKRDEALDMYASSRR